jgi:hypothetical protein
VGIAQSKWPGPVLTEKFAPLWRMLRIIWRKPRIIWIALQIIWRNVLNWSKLQSIMALAAAALIIGLVIAMAFFRPRLFEQMLTGAQLSVGNEIATLPASGMFSENWVRDISARIYAGSITIIALAATAIGLLTAARLLYRIGGTSIGGAILWALPLALAGYLACDRGPKILLQHKLRGEPFDSIAKLAKLDAVFDVGYWTTARLIGFIPVFYFVALFIALCFRL